MDQARLFYEEAVRVEPGYALALCGLAGFHAMQYNFTTDARTLHTAADYARRAIDVDPLNADAWTWLGYTEGRLGSQADAVTKFRRAMELDPSLFFPFYFFGCMGPAIGRFEESVGFLQRAVELEPTLSYPMWALACLHMQMGHYDEAFWAFERTAAVDRAAGEAAHWPGYDGFHGECLRRVGRLDEARERCLAALEDVEKSDHMYRDTNRVVCLVTLGRTALDQGDLAAARAAYGQAIAHVQGRQHTLAGGTLVVQALAGLARANSDPAAYADALDLYERQDRFDFSLYWVCADDTTLFDLSDAAAALGLADESRVLRDKAAQKGSVLALHASS